MPYKILLVDDDNLVRVGLRSMTDWGARGFQIVGEASDGREALALIDQLRPDVVITDMYMPECDGIGLVEEAARRWPDILFLVLSCHNDINYVKQSLRLGVFDYLLKSSIINSDEMDLVLDKMRATLEQRGRRGTAAEEVDPQPGPPKEQMDAQVMAFLKGERPADEPVTEYLRAAGIDLDSRDLFITALQMDSPEKFLGTFQELELARYAVTNILETLLDEYDGGVVLDTDGDVFYTVSSVHPKNSFVTPMEKTLCVCERFRISIKNCLNITCSIYVDEGRPLAELPVSFQNITQEINANSSLYYDTIVNLMDPDPSIYARMEGMEEGKDLPTDPVDDVLAYIHAHYHQQITLDELAKMSYVSKYHLCKKFKEKTKTSISNYILTVRIDKAKELLLEKRHKKYIIAQEVGFNDTPYFNRMFKKLTGYTPTEFIDYNHSV